MSRRCISILFVLIVSIAGFAADTVRIENDSLSVEIALKGAELQSLRSKVTGSERIEVAMNLHQNRRIPYLNNEDRLALNDPRVPNSGMFLKSVEARKIGVGPRGKASCLTLDLADFPNVNLWTPEGMPFVCIEPMVGHHDQIDAPYEISQKECVVSLAAGAIGRYRFTMTVNEDVPGP